LMACSPCGNLQQDTVMKCEVFFLLFSFCAET
jgi:hypothetical protein